MQIPDIQIAVVVGNPKPQSRTLAAARRVAVGLGAAPVISIDVVELGAGLLGWGDQAVDEAVTAVCSAEIVVVASPTYKASFTGLLKLFLDHIPTDGLAGVVAVPLMLGAGPGHALAPELHLKPVLVELGATCPTRALYVIDSKHDDDASYASWFSRAIPQVSAAVTGLRR